MSLNCEYLVTSNRERFLSVQLALTQRSIPHRIRIRSYPTNRAGKNAVLYTIYTGESHRYLTV